MSIRTIALACTAALLVACVQKPVFKGDDYAFLRSNYPIEKINGIDIEPVFRADIESGQTSAVVGYHTYQHNFICTFNWAAEAQTVYEVTSQENMNPLTMYRWVRRNGLWAARLDPIQPEDCLRESRR